MSIMDRIKNLDLNTFDLHEEQKRIFLNGMLELSIRLGDLNLFQSLFEKHKQFEFETVTRSVKTEYLPDVYRKKKGYDGNFNHFYRVDSALYEDMLREIGSPLLLEDEHDLYFDPFLMLFVIALELEKLPPDTLHIYMRDWFLYERDTYYHEVELIERADRAGQTEIIKYLLSKGATVPKGSSLKGELFREIYDEILIETIASSFGEPLLPHLENSPTYEDIWGWMEENLGIFLIEADHEAEYICAVINNRLSFYHMIRMKKDLTRSYFFLKKINDESLNQLERLERRNSSNQPLYDWLEKHGILYQSNLYPSVREKEGLLRGSQRLYEWTQPVFSTENYYDSLTRLIYRNYQTITRYNPVERDVSEYEEELVVCSRPYQNQNLKYFIDQLNEQYSKDFDDKQTFQRLVECFSKIDTVQTKYSNKKLLSYGLSQDKLYEIERSHWNEIGHLLKNFKSTFDELFSKIDKDYSFENIREQISYEDQASLYF